MPDRRPIAAGRFYSGIPAALSREVDTYLGEENTSNARPWALMLPHAGYMFCGKIIGATLRGMKLPPNLIILCPNHTGRGKALGVWPQGEWQTPLGAVKVNSKLAQEIIDTGTGFQADALSHMGEHSIEVLLPFLQKKDPSLTIVPICVGVQNAQILQKAANGLASVLKDNEADTALVVSSDMNHYEDEKTTILKDNLALAAIHENDPDKLLATVHANKISMCGAAPMALALYTARKLGNLEIVETAHDTSASASGDRQHVVGYAGVQMFMQN